MVVVHWFFREAAANNEAMAMILLQNLIIQVDEQLDRVSQEKNLLLIHNLKRVRKLLQVGHYFKWQIALHALAGLWR